LRASQSSVQAREEELKRRAEEYAENLLLLRELSEQRKIDPQSVSKYIMDPQVD
jgi:predicted RNase H-like HicB family nuclease